METVWERLEERVGLSRADLLGLAVALLGCVVATLVAVRVPLVHAASVPAATASPTSSAAAADQVSGPLQVHVAGAVAHPGVVELRTGDRVADAVAAAGGALPGAALDGLNLARPLVDGEQVLVPVAGEQPPVDGSEGGGGTTGARLPDGRLDLNVATAADLEELPGVGPVLAGRILAHREAEGPFTDAADLRDVAGIGEATWASLRDLVGVR